MKLKLLVILLVFGFLSTAVFSQTAAPSPNRVRIIQTNPTPVPINQPGSAPGAKVIVTNNLPVPTPTPRSSATPFQGSSVVAQPSNLLPVATPPPPTFYKPLAFSQIKNKIAEARRQMSARPIPTASSDSFLTNNVIRIAFYDYETGKIDYLVTSKTSFLSPNAQIATTTSNGKFVTLRILRPNYVNTAVMIVDTNNRAHLPLIVQYPVEKSGKFVEMAHYISTHAGIVTPEVVSAGKFYVRNVIDAARENLRKKNIFISPQVMDVAERLSIVEHVDHQRFFNESQPQIYNEIYALFALNEGQTYRYSVSTAGAGGMVQMIPWTYNMIRTRHYNVGLMPDFVEGMRNHQNAAQAMLLYMQMTWSDLNANATIYNALETGIATPTELMSAGYNSNPSKLAGYIRRGGANWKTLIPRETKVYLQIYASMDRYVPVLPRTK
ncbi:MAG: hypothetical protein WKF90_06195 [Pyrinomonadaceae bacterium]